MKTTKRLRIAIASALLAACMLLMSSCGMLLPSLMPSGDSDSEYITREELESLLGGKENITPSAPGDEYNIPITPNSQSNLLAASKALLSVVSIYCNFKMDYTIGFGPNSYVTTKDYSSAGSGVIYKLDKTTGDAYIITNYHVVYDASSNTANGVSNDISIYLYGQETKDYKIPAVYVGGSMQYDLAVLKVTGSNVLKASNAAAVTVADSNDIAVLETAIVIGNPEAGGISATVGNVNVDSEYITMTGADNKTAVQLRVIRTDAAVNSGNSGGGMFNDKGELIGIVNAKMASSSIDNIGYAIPSNIAKYITENILFYCDGKDAECVYRCILGISLEAEKSYTEYDTVTGKVHKIEKVVISEVTEGGIAKGSLEAGDVINSITIDGVKYDVTRIYNVVDSMLNARVGSSVVFNIERNGVKTNVNLSVTEATLTPYK